MAAAKPDQVCVARLRELPASVAADWSILTGAARILLDNSQLTHINAVPGPLFGAGSGRPSARRS